MSRVRSTISMLLLALLLFPAAEKLLHELSHTEDDHCGITETHFCQEEHHCSLCDYVFSSSAVPPGDLDELKATLQSAENNIPVFLSGKTSSQTLTLSLRGPPAC